jgi:hypothetical protein
LTSLRTGAQVSCSFAQALLSVEIVEAAFASAANDSASIAIGQAMP